MLAVAGLLLLTTIADASAELTVEVSPARAYAAPGGEVLFSATVHEDGNEVAPDVGWSVIPPRVGTIGGDGRFVAGDRPGRAIIRALAVHGGATGAGHAVLEVGPAPPARLSVQIEPLSAVLEPGGEQRFSFTATDPLTGAEVEAEARWVVIPEGLGSISEAGLFTAAEDDGAGRIAVRATSNGREGVGDATIVVGSPPEPGARVSIAPPHALVAPGESFQFDVTVVDGAGDPISADVEWMVMPARLGSVDESGLFAAGPDEGVGRLVASVATREGPARGFASVEIRRPGPGGVTVRIRPREAAVALGGDVQFEALVAGPDGEPLDVPVEWSVHPPWIGTIDADGRFAAYDDMPEASANGAWIGTVSASVETHAGLASDAARVIVRDAGPGTRLKIDPRRPIVAPGQEIQFEARVIGAGEPIEWTTEWAVFPGHLGTITPGGLFTANPVFADASSNEFGPHEGVVAARATLADGSTLTDRAHVRVRIPGQPVRVSVRPAFAIVPPGESVEFDAVVMGPDGNEIDLPVLWKANPEHLGRISPEGVFTAADVNVQPDSWQRPRGTVIAEVRIPGGRVFRGAAIVVIDLPDPQLLVHVSPKSVTLKEGDSVQFQAEASLIDGTPIHVDFEWRVTDPLVGMVDDSGFFKAALSIPEGHARRTTVLVGCVYEGRLYWDFATVRVSQG
jgi:hypothetical protein